MNRQPALHFDDVRKLLEVLHRLADLGNTVIIIEHNLDVIRNADWIIDLGPEGGERRRHDCGRGYAGDGRGNAGIVYGRISAAALSCDREGAGGCANKNAGAESFLHELRAETIESAQR